MPARYHIYPQFQLKFVSIWGKTELAELMALATRYSLDPDFDSKNRMLVDLSDLKDAKATFRDVFALNGFYERTFAAPDTPMSVAISAPTGLGYGLARMFSALTSGKPLMHVEIFRSVSDAATYLNIDLDKLKDTQNAQAKTL
ncbi:hypothetical protein ASD8599_01561 [Ascidiaceihabitans donghaensis]|uniref:Uncharacterized protein n=1 Tax=Ascidiaceihabitans donghaensis TaxID=1510460 RepID=A0A2R8BCR5_9RHOB|nr:hypothetical protein [Ascidiaceihabitans donghaensis]SPH20820.1 hypothetical protein ASD8599_01561 [Ascidiaceihabitans donghaensis]